MVRYLAEEAYPRAERVRLWCATTSRPTHRRLSTRPSRAGARPSLGPKDRVLLHAGARLVAEHGVEIELSVLVRQCLGRRLADIETLGREAQAWCRERNRTRCERGLALQDGGCAHQASQPLPISERVTED